MHSRLLSAGGQTPESLPDSSAWRLDLALYNTATCLHARHNTQDDFWIPPDPSLSELVFKAAETGQDSKRQEHLATVKRRLPDAALEVVHCQGHMPSYGSQMKKLHRQQTISTASYLAARTVSIFRSR